jgi:hypothetical protein
MPVAYGTNFGGPSLEKSVFFNVSPREGVDLANSG